MAHVLDNVYIMVFYITYYNKVSICSSYKQTMWKLPVMRAVNDAKDLVCRTKDAHVL